MGNRPYDRIVTARRLKKMPTFDRLTYGASIFAIIYMAGQLVRAAI